MSEWKNLIEKHKKAQIALVKNQALMGFTQAEAARNLGLTRQQLNRFCQINGIKFKRSYEEGVNFVE